MAGSVCSHEHTHNKQIVQRVASSVPLGAAVVAPLITLLDIPALSQRWYYLYGAPTADSSASIAMSAVSLSFCVIGNALLIVRFSSNVLSVRALVVEAPLVAFWIKTIVEVVNLSLYGRISTRSANHSYGQGFWCAVFSCGLSGVVAVLLLFHFVVQRRQDWKDSIRIRIDGRHFMLSVLAFVSVIGIQALIFSKIEGWYFFDGVYFSIVSCLTVGFGDFAPTKTSTKILLFPFTILTIALLANQISTIVGYFAHQTELRRNKYHAQQLFLARQGRSADNAERWGLKEEMHFLTQMQERERRVSQVYNMVLSLSGFLSFWILGAVIFMYSESWTMGNSLYFSFVFYLTLGYGDFAPISNFGRVFFVLYSLVAVPVVASFAVQTLTTVVERMSERELSAQRLAREHLIRAEPDADPMHKEEETRDDLHPHAHFVFDNWAKLERQAEEQTESSAGGSDEERRQSQSKLVDEALDLACQLESLSRSMLIGTLPKAGKAQILLRADRNVQRRDITAIGADSDELQQLWKEEDELAGSNDEEFLRSVKRYRETFAKLLVVGAQLRRLEGTNRQAFLRVRDEHAEEGSVDGDRAQREMEIMNEMDGAIEVQASDGRQLEVKVNEPKGKKG